MDNKCLIVIISLNQVYYTRGCIESILKNTDYPHRILIVDNGSDTETIEYLKYLKEGNIAEVIFNNENRGWVKAVNQGVYYSDSLYVCIMNNDTIVYPGWLSEMISIIQKDDSIGLVNPLWELPKRFIRTREDYFNKIVTNQRGQFIETDWVRGFCFLTKREVINKVGGLNEAFSPAYYDDWDYSIRAIRAGFRCVRAQGAFVWHYKNITYPKVLGGSEFNSLFQEKEKVFYGRWGRPLRILLITNSLSNENLPLLKDFGLLLLRDQNKLFIISSQRELNIEHTNCRMRYSRTPMVGMRAVLNIMNNFRHSSSKRYDLILCSPKINKFLKKFFFIRNNYLIKEIDYHYMTWWLKRRVQVKERRKYVRLDASNWMHR